jgi:thioredoxin reductase (NADPH)
MRLGVDPAGTAQASTMPAMNSADGDRKITIASLRYRDTFTKTAGGTNLSTPPPSPLLSPSQLAFLAEIGEERSAPAGEVLYQVGDRSYPFIAILEGEVAIIDAAGNEIVRHRASGFLGELNLLSGQTVFLNALVIEPVRYIAVERGALRSLLNEDGPLSDLILSTFIARREALQSVEGIGLEIVGPHGSETTMRMLEFARANRLPYTWEETTPPDGGALPLVRLPGGGELYGPTPGQVLRALGIGLELAPREEVDLLVVGAGPAGLAAAVYGASEGLNTLVVESTALGGQAGSSRRIENYLGFPAGISGTELTSRAVTQARKFNARTATPYRALSLEPGNGRHLVRLEDDKEIAARAVLLATGAQYRRLPVDRLAEFEGLSVFYAAGPPEAQLCAASRVAVVGGGNSAGQAAVWLARGGALVTLLHRRADLRETMSDYLIHELERYGVAVRDRSEIAELHGDDGHLEAVTLIGGERVPFSFLFLFLGALPCTEWLDDTVGRDHDGFILTGAAANADNLLETDIPGVFAAGDVRSGSTKRCATAVGEGAMAVQFAHAHLSRTPAVEEVT